MAIKFGPAVAIPVADVTIGDKGVPRFLERAPSVTGQRRGRGRPKIEGLRPWDIEGISRATWNRRRKEEKAK